MTPDELFQQAVALIGSGDVPALERLLADHPQLARERLTAPGPWRGALGGFFQDPSLVPKLRLGTAVFETRFRETEFRPGAFPNRVWERARKLDSTLRLVAWSGIAQRVGVQIELLVRSQFAESSSS